MINWNLSYALFPVVIMFVILIMNEDVSPKRMFSVFTISMLSALPTAFIEMMGSWLLTAIYIDAGLDLYAHYPLVQTSYSAIIAFVVVALTEESFKLISFQMVANKIHDVYSAIIYGATAALGFAAIENILYVVSAERFSIIVAGFRAVLSIPVHTVTGIIIGLAFVNDGRRKTSDKIILFTMCVMLHGTYDFLLETIKDYADNNFMVLTCLAGLGTIILITYALLISLIVAMKRRHKIDRKVHLLQVPSTTEIDDKTEIIESKTETIESNEMIVNYDDTNSLSNTNDRLSMSGSK